MKGRIACLQWKAKKSVEKRLGFPFEKTIESTDRFPITEGQKLLKQRLDFQFDKRIETINRLLIMQGQTIVEPTVTFPY